MANWWDAAPLAQAAPASAPAASPTGNWWDAAPLVKQSTQSLPAQTAQRVVANTPTIGRIADNAGQLAQGIVKGIPNALDMGGAAVATLADKAMGSKKGWGDTFSEYADTRPVSSGVDALLGTKEREAQYTEGRWINAGGQAIGSLGLGGVKAAASAPMMARAMIAGTSGAAASDVGTPVGGYVGELVGGEEGRKIGETVGGVGAGLLGAVVADRKATRAGEAFKRGFQGTAPVITPKTAQLQKTKTDLYKAAENSGTAYDKSKLTQVADAVEQDLIRQGYSPDGHPYTRQMLNRVREGQNTTLPGVDSLRQGAYKGPDGADGAFSKKIGARVAAFMDDDANLIAGSPKEGILLNRQARDANKAFEAARIADDLEREVRTRARGTTAETASTNFIRNLADDEQRMKFLSPQQQKIIEDAAVTGNFQRALKIVGGLGPNRMVGAVNLGASIANPALLGANALGVAAQLGEKGIMNARTSAVKNALRSNPNLPERAGRAVRDLMGIDNTLPPSPFGPATPPAGTVPPVAGAITRSPMAPAATPTATPAAAPATRNNQRGSLSGYNAPLMTGAVGLAAANFASSLAVPNTGPAQDAWANQPKNVQMANEMAKSMDEVEQYQMRKAQEQEQQPQSQAEQDQLGDLIRQLEAEQTAPQTVSATHTIKEEGFKPRVYKDSRGFKTVGIGFNMDQNGAKLLWNKSGIPENFDRVASGREQLSEASAQQLFQFKSDRAAKIAQTLVPNFSKLGENQRAALEGMVYQLGATGARKFQQTLGALKRNNPEAVVYGVLSSDWAKQTPARAKRAALMLAYDLPPEQAERILLANRQISQNELKYVGAN